MTTNSETREDSLRAANSPLFNNRKLKLGTFCTNLSGGCAISSVGGVLQADWPTTLALAQAADEMEFEALVPGARWKGFGGISNFNEGSFECFSWASAIGARTRDAGVFATSHVQTIHPIMAAKQAATIDHVTGGRFGLNIVAGWYRPEIEMFGLEFADHDARYDSANEWINIIKRLWTEEEAFDFDGKFYHIRKGTLHPKPLRQPHPVIMNAGGSERGMHFAAKHCDLAFIVLEKHDVDAARAKVDNYRRLAREEYGREIQVWTYSYVVQGGTEQDALSFFNHYVNEKGDWEAATTLLEALGLNSQSIPPAMLEGMKRHFIAGWGGYPLVGTNEQIVEQLQTLSDIGVDGTLLSWPRYLDGIRQFQAETLPLARQAGLR